ncbi:uncharacterized protein LOC119688604 [Teleopsis dalmanni]|uniref:uncharacterized protein LOC119688604 n=1 Tax=Teleopsis dalmanni TaxID=139649 RepID=UPI0018CC8F1A|nr:uncharacterized protein LOC119688604 [Teleopsis dalmanni]
MRNFGFVDSTAPCSGKLIVENDKGMEIVESDHHISTVYCSIVQEQKIAQKTVWNHLNKAGYKKIFDPTDRIFIGESVLNRNKIETFLKWLVTGDEKWIIYGNVKRKQ